VLDQSLANSLPTNVVSSCGGVGCDAGTKTVENGEEMPSIRHHFMHSEQDNTGVEHDPDPAEPRIVVVSGSAPGSVAQLASPAQLLSGAGALGSSAAPPFSPPHASPGAAAHGNPPTGGDIDVDLSVSGSVAAPGGSGVQTPSVPYGAPSQPGGANSRPVTRLQHGISKPKMYTDGTMRWGMLSSVKIDEPVNLEEALQDKRWVQAMDNE
jgi:hypothetical protein